MGAKAFADRARRELQATGEKVRKRVDDTGTELTPLELPQDYWVVLCVPHGEQKQSTASVYARFDERDGGAGYEARRRALLDGLAAVRRPRDLAELPENDLASAPLAAELRELGAFRADVTCDTA